MSAPLADDRVTQTIVAGDPRPGNCFAACVATALQRPLAQVPHFVEWGISLGDAAGPSSDDEHAASSGAAWWAMFLGYLFANGLHVVQLDDLHDAEPGELVFVHGLSPRGVTHQVLYLDGQLWHDPHPSRDGLLSITPSPFVLRPVPAGGHDHGPTNERSQG